MKNEATPTTETKTLDQIIADAKARREQEKKEHEETMRLLNQLKNNSIFAK